MASTRQAIVIGLLTRKSDANLQIFFENLQLFSKKSDKLFNNLKINENRRQNLLFPNIFIPLRLWCECGLSYKEFLNQ